MGMPSCDCIPPDGDINGKWIRECDYHREMRKERDFFRRLCTHAGLLAAQEEHNDAITRLENRIRMLESRLGVF